MSKKKEQKKVMCLECGDPFIVRRPWQKFCHKRCRWIHFTRENPRVSAEELARLRKDVAS